MLVATFFILSSFLSLKIHVAYGNARSIDHQIKRLEEEVWKKAQDLSLSAYEEPTLNLPDPIANLTYDQWRDIRFKPEQSLWRGSDSLLELRFYHLGFLYKTPVKINLVTSEVIEEFPFDVSLFDYGKNALSPENLNNLGFAGFRIHYPLNRDDYYDELISFLGASYFRALGKGQRYGLSARGLAVDTALPKGEEFPFFKEFWIVKPPKKSRNITVFALLDSPSLTGAYKFYIQPGEKTAVDVKASIFRRKDVEKLGIAPMTSMFYYGENSISLPDDYRPEVHDSDGLLIAYENGEWEWRPLRNLLRLDVTSFPANNVAGFGLLQRDIDFDHYQDLEARYDLRPSLWIAPRGSWGKGRVELIEIPTNWETTDNIVAFWVPEELPPLGEPVDISYRMSWHLPLGSPHGLGYVVATRTGKGSGDNTRLFVVDFIGKAVEEIPADTGLTAVVKVSDGGELVEKVLTKNEVTGGWRLAIQVKAKTVGAIEQLQPDKRPKIEIQAFLKRGDNLPDLLTEKWSYLWQL
jgi:glucans biosynthesis protein